MKLNVTHTVTNKDGEGVNLSNNKAPVGNKFAPVTPGYYNALLLDTTTTIFDGKKGPILKITPRVELLNDVRTGIYRQDILVGNFDPARGGLYRTDGDLTKSALWGGFPSQTNDGAYDHGAQQLFAALGLLEGSDGQYRVTVDLDAIRGFVFKVKVENVTYTKNDGSKGVKNHMALFYGLTDADIEAYNAEHEDTPLHVVDVSADFRQVFINPESYDAFVEVNENGDDSASANGGWE